MKRYFLVGLILTQVACPGFGDKTLAELEPNSGPPPTWENSIKDLLSQRCGGCHGATPSGGAPQGFRLDVYNAAEAGSGDGAFEKRMRIYARVVDANPGPMPPGSGLSDADRQKVGEWVMRGAPKAEAN